MGRGTVEGKSKIFEVSYNGLSLEYELFTMEYIMEQLQQLRDKEMISSFESIEVPQKKVSSIFRTLYLNKEKKEKYHYCAYIKFFEYGDKIYGLVGGKTNYPVPDVSFDYLQKNDNRIARTFLKEKNLNGAEK